MWHIDARQNAAENGIIFAFNNCFARFKPRLKAGCQHYLFTVMWHIIYPNTSYHLLILDNYS
jgi:hypothetical protein